MAPHILIYTDDFGLGGVAQYNHAIALGLIARGYRVTQVQSRSDNPLVREQAAAGVHHEWLGYDTVQDFNRTLSDGRDAQQIFRKVQPDFILFSDSCPISNVAAKQAAIDHHIPYLIVVGFVADYLGDRFNQFFQVLEEQLAVAREVVAVSQENLQLLRNRFGLSRSRGRVIHYGRPDSFFTPQQAETRHRLRAELKIGTQDVLCFTAARLEYVKGYDLQLEAIAHLKEQSIWQSLHFVWAGEGSLREHLQQQITELGVGDRVHLLGQRWDVVDWLNAADIFLLPSRLEGMPLAIMEAMAKGLPVLASAVSGIPEELGDTGKLLPDPNSDRASTIAEMTKTLQTWATQPDQRQSVGTACRQRANQMFQQARMIDETLRLIETLMLPEGDYVSPGLSIVRPDAAFPNMVVGDRQGCGWPYLRREIPHNWYVDQRQPVVGFLSRDEAHILYNTALQFRGQRALEIGCWMGWSACHLALAGVELDVVDPLLERPEFYESVSQSLTAAGVRDRVSLHPGYSPGAVQALAQAQNRKWSLIFIDGNHEAPGPLEDAIACEQLAAEDAIILFHDLASPDVAQGLDYFRNQGWNTLVYQTMQIMGIAWRGQVQPLAHRPDPQVNWTLPTHLHHYSVSGWDTAPQPPSLPHQLFDLIQQLQPLPPLPAETPDVAQSVAKNLQQGKTAYVRGAWPEALAYLQQAVQQNPGAAIAHAYLSALYGRQGQLQASLQHFAWASIAHLALGQATVEEFKSLVAVVRPYTLLSEERLFSLYALTKQICLEDLPGNFVECGTFKGGATALIAAVIKRYSQRPRKLYACDTYEGMPDPLAVDKHEGVPANDTGLGAGTLKAPIEENLAVVCHALGVSEIVVPLKGLFQDTLPLHRAEIGEIVLLHADGDWYESTLTVFNLLYEQVVLGGAIQIDDYGFWEGCRQAIHEFERQQHTAFPLRRIDSTGVWFRKGDTVDPAWDYQHWLFQYAWMSERQGDRTLALQATTALLRLVPNLLTAEVLYQTLQTQLQDTLRPQEVSLAQQAQELIQRYQANPFTPDAEEALTTLRHFRRQIAERWSEVSLEQLEVTLAGDLGQAHRLIMDSGIRLEALNEEEEAIAFSLIANLSQGLCPDNVVALLAATLYCYPHHLPEVFDLKILPLGLVEFVVTFLSSPPPIFQELGEVEIYADYLEQWIAFLYQQQQAQPDSNIWQQAVHQFAICNNMIPLYFSERNLKRVHQQRAALIERSLMLHGYELDHGFTDYPANHKIRVGILAAHFSPQSETFASLPAYKHLNREDFEIILFSGLETHHRLERYCAGHADQFVLLPETLADQVKLIRQFNLDIALIVTNITAVSNGITWLAAHRLARVQVMNVCSCVSSGFRSVDAFISGTHTGPANPAEQYTEQVLMIDGSAHCYDFATEQFLKPSTDLTREDLGIAQNEIVYVSGGNFFKITPEVESLWVSILQEVPRSRLVLYPFNPNWSNHYPKTAFLRRFLTTLNKAGIARDRLVLLDATENQGDVKARLQLGNIYLDTFPFSGVTSLLDPLLLGLPSILMDGNSFRARMGGAFLRSLGCPELVARSLEDYKSLAIALGQDPTLCRQWSRRIQIAMEQNPDFLDGLHYSTQYGQIFRELFQTYQQRQLVESLRLRDRNLIALPDWQQPEDVLFAELADLLRTVITAPGGEETTLLVDMGNLDAQEADFALSSVTLYLLEEEEIELGDNAPEVTLLPPLPADQWELLRPRLTARIDMPHSNTAAIARAGLDALPVQSVG
jgi:predicted O-linked N-acetylglucosamine transferase (SPINDLY family)/glycosyltransferase involved in cell wall biosynthesis/predicted O-methyltransferase YrrM